MIILRTAGEVKAFLATPLGRQTEPILTPYFKQLAEFVWHYLKCTPARIATELRS